MFTAPAGGPLTRATLSDAWRRAGELVGIPKGDGYHQLRHFYASTLIQGGESVKTVQERLGHATASITLDTYSHLFPADEDKTRQVVGSALESLSHIGTHAAEADG